MIASPIRFAIESTFIFSHSAVLWFNGIVSVTTRLFNSESLIRWTAGPESTGCVQQAWTSFAPFPAMAAAASINVPAVIGHIIEYDDLLSADIADNRHCLGHVRCFPALVNNGMTGIQAFCKGPGSFNASCIRRDNHNVVIKIVFNIFKQNRGSKKIVNRDVEKALDLTGMQIQGNDSVSTGGVRRSATSLALIWAREEPPFYPVWRIHNRVWQRWSGWRKERLKASIIRSSSTRLSLTGVQVDCWQRHLLIWHFRLFQSVSRHHWMSLL